MDRGLHLTGERPCCEALNDSIEQLLNSMVLGGGVSVGGRGDIGGPYFFNPNAAADISTSPNSLSSWFPNGPGGLGGLGTLPDENILITGTGQVPVAGVWDCSDLVNSKGRITLLMDVNWFSGSDRLPAIENIQEFLGSAGNSCSSARSTLRKLGPVRAPD